MNYQQAMRDFRENYWPALIAQGKADDRIYFYETWSAYTDALCKDGIITQRQYDTWRTPAPFRITPKDARRAAVLGGHGGGV